MKVAFMGISTLQEEALRPVVLAKTLKIDFLSLNKK